MDLGVRPLLPRRMVCLPFNTILFCDLLVDVAYRELR